MCTSCDGFCPLTVKVKDGQVVKVTTRSHPLFKDVICMKGAFAPKAFAHPSRILYPLKRVGERGSGEWEQVSWDAEGGALYYIAVNGWSLYDYGNSCYR